MFVRASKYYKLLKQKQELVRTCIGWLPSGSHEEQLKWCKAHAEHFERCKDIEKESKKLEELREDVAYLEKCLPERLLQIHQIVEATTQRGYQIEAEYIIKLLKNKWS